MLDESKNASSLEPIVDKYLLITTWVTDMAPGDRLHSLTVSFACAAFFLLIKNVNSR